MRWGVFSLVTFSCTSKKKLPGPRSGSEALLQTRFALTLGE